MFQIDNSTAASSQPASTAPGAPGFFTDGNPAGSTPATVVPAEWLNLVMMELINAVKAGGQVPSKSVFNQLALGMLALGSPYAADASSTVNQITVAFPAGYVRNESQMVRIKVALANTGAVTINDGIGTVPLVGGAHVALQGGELVAGGDMFAFWNSSIGSAPGSYVLAEGLGGAVQVGTGTKSQHAVTLGQVSSMVASPNGARSNLAISYTGTSGVVTVSANAITVQSTSGLATLLKNLSLSATSGNASGAANSLDTGSWAFGTCYNLFVIYNPTTQTAALLWSLSATAPTLPSGYTYFALVSANFTQSATNYWFMGGTQFNDEFFTKVAASGNRVNLQLLSGGVSGQGSVSTPTFVAVSLAAYVPPNASKVLLMCNSNGGSGGQSMVAPSANFGASSSVTNPVPFSLQTPGNSAGQVLCMQGEIALESTNIYWAQTGNFYLWMRGWKINL